MVEVTATDDVVTSTESAAAVGAADTAGADDIEPPTGDVSPEHATKPVHAEATTNTTTLRDLVDCVAMPTTVGPRTVVDAARAARSALGLAVQLAICK